MLISSVSSSKTLTNYGVFNKDNSPASSSSNFIQDSYANQIDKEFNEIFEDVKDSYDTLKEITSKGAEGYWSWQLKNLKKKIAEQIMGEMGVTKESLAKMPSEERIRQEKLVMDELKKRIEEIVRNEIKKEQKENVLKGNSLSDDVVSSLLQMA